MMDPNGSAAIIAACASMFTAMGLLLNAIVSFMGLMQSRANHTVAKSVEAKVNGSLTEMKSLYNDREEARVAIATITGDVRVAEARAETIISVGAKNDPLQNPVKPA